MPQLLGMKIYRIEDKIEFRTKKNVVIATLKIKLPRSIINRRIRSLLFFSYNDTSERRSSFVGFARVQGRNNGSATPLFHL